MKINGFDLFLINFLIKTRINDSLVGKQLPILSKVITSEGGLKELKLILVLVTAIVNPFEKRKF